MVRPAGRQPAAGDLSDYPVRVSEVGGVCLTSIGTSSIAQFGDRADVDANLRAIAVQRESDHLDKDNVYFESYDLFSQPVPLPTPWLLAAAQDPVDMRTINREPRISVGCIDVIAISGSALVLVGNGLNTKGQSRISNIRQFAKPPMRYYGTGCCPPMQDRPRNDRPSV
ncbi:spore germination protein GerPE [Paenibacillus lycopersici]|uniref:Spore germination protein GerPE n=1 Tax=Paenibacillus lycopersici TaxID=2704462 RepID=A0A6C0G1U3_9BACL|nr:spore germination protein GerPE [Paenibacillus lycopersici]QHT61893.1 spore germination protein GerPE [Paenibacillus lycopersici]